MSESGRQISRDGDTDSREILHDDDHDDDDDDDNNNQLDNLIRPLSDTRTFRKWHSAGFYRPLPCSLFIMAFKLLSDSEVLFRRT